MILSLLKFLVGALVDACATFLASILSHEAVQTAGANMMVRAMNEFLRQPDLNDHVRCMSETMAKHQQDYARSAGEDFPKLAGQFIQGMLSPKKERTAALRRAEETLPLSTNTTPVPPPPVVENTSTKRRNSKTTPQKSNSFLNIPALGGLDGGLRQGGLRQRLGSGARAS